MKTTLRMKRTYQAPAQRVFDAWTNPEVMRRWWHAERDWETSEAEVDLRVGGNVRVVMRDPGEGVEHGGGGRYTVVDPPHRLAFTWTWDDVPHETLIEIEFEESDGSTEVRFTHSSLLGRGDGALARGWLEPLFRQPRADPAAGRGGLGRREAPLW